MRLRQLAGVLVITTGSVVIVNLPACSSRCACSSGAETLSGSPGGCTLSREALQSRQNTVREILGRRALRWHELPDGFAFVLPGDEATVRQVLNLIRLERDCCRFIRFTVVLEPNGGNIRLEMRSDAANRDTLRRLLEPTGVLSRPDTP